MGAWGTGIFADDDAADVRANYRQLLGDGVTTEDATRLLIEKWRPVLDANLAQTFWLALAASEVEMGRLQPETRSRALEIIDSGSDLEIWRESKTDVSRRAAVLRRLRAKLVAFTPGNPKAVKKQFVDDPGIAIGDVLAVNVDASQIVLLRVIALLVDEGGRRPWIEICDWRGVQPPALEEIATLPARRCWREAFEMHVVHFVLVARQEREYQRNAVRLIGRLLGETRSPPGCSIERVLYWKTLVADLNLFFSF